MRGIMHAREQMVVTTKSAEIYGNTSGGTEIGTVGIPQAGGWRILGESQQSEGRCLV